MDRQARNFLKKLLDSPSPSGFEQPAQKLVRKELKNVADKVSTDVHGNVIAVMNPGAPLRVMIAGHCDEVGLMVNHIDDNGYLYFSAIGDVDPVILPGQRVEIHNSRAMVLGVIGKKASQLMEPDESGRALKIKEHWIDIGACDRKDALKAVAIGDPVTITREMTDLRNGLITARGLDDRVGVWIVVQTIRKLQKISLNCAVYGVSTVQKELGMRGAKTAAYGIDPQVGIAVDVGFASDSPASDKKVNGDIALGKGPILHRGANINPQLAMIMEGVAKRKRIAIQMQAEPRASLSDSNVMQINRSGAAASLVSVPNRYMHTPVEVVSLKDLDDTVALLAGTIAQLKPAMDFTP
jgi:putative aminopeptidase FrvX